MQKLSSASLDRLENVLDVLFGTKIDHLVAFFKCDNIGMI